MAIPKNRFLPLCLLLSALPHLNAQPTLALTTTPNPSRFGAAVTLTAAITPATATGTVTFYDGVTVLGAKALASGTASLSTIALPAGTRKLRAWYSGVTSNVVTQTVNAQPTVGFAAAALSFPTGPIVIATADFNRDGKPDLATVTPQGGAVYLDTFTLTILLGDGGGTFHTSFTTTLHAFPNILSTATAATSDFNGDGIIDLVIPAGEGVNILLGKGDGTFQAPLAQGFPYASNAVAVADFNGDGFADIAAASNTEGVYLLLGKGDGTLQPAVTWLTAPQSPRGSQADFLLAADFAATNANSNILSILPGNGDGSFQTPTLITLTDPPLRLAVGDFNRDGKPDLAIGAAASSSTYILLGNGDGTFQFPDFYPFGAAVRQGDFNGDGFIDLVVAGTSGILYGNGDGTFRQGLTLQSGAPLAVADFNGDGRADLMTASPTGVTLLLGSNGAALITLTAVGGSQQSALVGSAFAAPLQVKVLNNGNPLSGATVTFSVPTVGASAALSSATALTDASGIAGITATANNIPGGYVVTATVGGLSTTFALSNVTAAGPTNLALHMAASQSTTLPGVPSAAASSAVDGNTSGNFYEGSVTATDFQTSPWWQVDLGATSTVNSVVLYNRTDCCASRLADYWVFVSDTPFLSSDTPATLATRAGTFSSHQTTAPAPSATIDAGGYRARYVRVQLTGSDYLSLAEVQVNGTAGVSSSVNLAANGLTAQSSTLAGIASAGSQSAVDGNPDGNFFHGSVTATNQETNPWWQVDLAATAYISSVVVWNRTDCCTSRLNDYWVFISNTPFLATDTPATLQTRAGTYAFHQTTAPNPSTSIPTVIHPCPPAALCADFLAPGRYVRIQLSGTDFLSLAEVQVFGTGGAPSPTLVSQGKPATQSSTLAGSSPAAAAAAVDGSTDGNFFHNSVTATNLETSPWWQVDLGASTPVSQIVIWNRTDCCASRLTDYWVFVSDTPFLASDTPATLQTRAATVALHQTTAPSPSVTIPLSAQGRYVRVQLSGSDYLSLAEVRIFQ